MPGVESPRLCYRRSWVGPVSAVSGSESIWFAGESYEEGRVEGQLRGLL